MPIKNNGRQTDARVKIERAIVLHVLNNDRQTLSTHADLECELGDIAPDALNSALLSLERAGAIERSHETVWASHAAQRLDELGLIGV
jgi:DNA-binding HxlR family transcriptional regulator